MNQPNCCPTPDLQWTPRRIEKQWADVQFCASCGHVHRTEKYAFPKRFPYNDRCINCTGDLHQLEPGGGSDPRNLACTVCKMSMADAYDLHARFAKLHPEGSFLAAAEALAEVHRYVLALKLTTAEIRFGPDPVLAEIQRLALLDAMGQSDLALDEAYAWADNEGTPSEVHGVIAMLEASAGNFRAAQTALERGLSMEPERTDWWCDYADIMLQQDDRQNAARAAGHAIKDPATEQRAIHIISEIAERYYASGQFAEALGTCSIAGDKQQTHEAITWLRARIAAVNQDTDYLVRWLKLTVALNPSHPEATEMLAPYNKKRGWFGF